MSVQLSQHLVNQFSFLSSPILNEKGAICIELRGLKCMESNPSKAKVLYFKAHEETGLLQKISDDINDYFIQQGNIVILNIQFLHIIYGRYYTE